MKSVIAGVILGIAALAIAPHVHAKPTSNFPIPLCPPDQPNCSLNQ